MTTTADPRTLGQLFSVKRERLAPEPSFQEIADHILVHHGERVTDQTIANYHRDRVKRLDPMLVASIADFYGLTMEDLPEDAQARCRRAQRVLVLIDGGLDVGRLVPGGAKQKDPGTSQTSRSRGNRTLSNRTGSGRHRGAGRAPVQPDFPPHNPEHPGYPIAN